MSEAKCLAVIEQMLSCSVLEQINQVIDDHSSLCVPSYINGSKMIIKCKYKHK